MDSNIKLQKKIIQKDILHKKLMGDTALERSSTNVDLNLFYEHQTSHLIHPRSNRQECTVHLNKDCQMLLGNKVLVTSYLADTDMIIYVKTYFIIVKNEISVGSDKRHRLSP